MEKESLEKSKDKKSKVRILSERALGNGCLRRYRCYKKLTNCLLCLDLNHNVSRSRVRSGIR